jgi:peptidylprolyl isomerase
MQLLLPVGQVSATCRAHYSGRLEINNSEFDSSYERGRPLTFRVGKGEVIKGWDEGIAGGEGCQPCAQAGSEH